MDDSPTTVPPALPVPRPFPLTLLCVFSFVFFGLICLLFLVAAFYPQSITEAINEYIPEGTTSPQRVVLFALGGFCMHAAALTGVILILKMRKTGYFIFGIASLIISVYHLFQDKISFLTTSVYIILIILFGIYYKKLK